MTERDTLALAHFIRDTRGYCEPFTGRQIAHLAGFCQQQTPKFNRKRWFRYLGVGVGV